MTRSALTAAVFRLTTEIQSSAACAPLRQLLRDLGFDLDVGALPKSERLGYTSFAGRYGVRLSGAAAPIQMRSAKLWEPPLGPHTLSDAEANLLLSVARAQVRLSRHCIAPLLDRAPIIWRVCDPDRHLIRYADREPGEHLKDAAQDALAAGTPKAGETDTAALWQTATAERFAAEFQKHPAIAVALRLLDSGFVDTSPQKVTTDRKMVARLENEIEVAGVSHLPTIWQRIVYRIPVQDARRLCFEWHAALLALRRSLNAFQQLVFQRLVRDRLTTITDDDLVSVPWNGGTELGRVAELRIAQPYPRKMGWRDIALLTADLGLGENADPPPLVEVRVRRNVGSKYGNITESGIRILDDFMNPLPGLAPIPERQRV